MKNIKLTILTCLFCVNSMYAQKINCDNIYQMEIPNSMCLMDMNPDAIFEISNYLEEQYLIVIHESKAEFKAAIGSKEKNILPEYTNYLSDSYAETFNGKSSISSISFNNYFAKDIVIIGESDGVPIIWHTIAVETELYLYQICYWTISEKDNTKENLKLLLDVAQTFEEL